MPEELTTRDVFQQVDARLTRVEDDLRHLRSDTNVGFSELTGQISQVNSELTGQISQLNLRFDQLQWRLIGLFVLTWVTVISSVWLKP